MSIRVMTAVWALDLSAGDKLLLLALADCANDDGHCYPGMRNLVGKTGKCERSIQASIKSLVAAGHLTRNEVPGKGCNYTVHPRNNCAPEKSAPPQKLTRTPAKTAGKPSGTIIGIEANASTPSAWARPHGVDVQVWKDLLSNRKRKHKTNSPTAWKRFCDDLGRVSASSGIPPNQLIEHAAAQGWAGIYDPNARDRQNGHGKQSSGLGKTAAAIAGLGDWHDQSPM